MSFKSFGSLAKTGLVFAGKVKEKSLEVKKQAQARYSEYVQPAYVQNEHVLVNGTPLSAEGLAILKMQKGMQVRIMLLPEL